MCLGRLGTFLGAWGHFWRVWGISWGIGGNFRSLGAFLGGGRDVSRELGDTSGVLGTCLGGVQGISGAAWGHF